jgi:hypothetical protein
LDPKKNFIYLMTDASGYYSIGYSRNPKRKALELRKVNPTIKLVSTRKESHGTASRRAASYHGKYAHRRVVGEWFALSDKELVELLKDFDVQVTSAAIGEELSKLTTPVHKRDKTGLKRAFRERFSSAYPATLRPHLQTLTDNGLSIQK